MENKTNNLEINVGKVDNIDDVNSIEINFSDKKDPIEIKKDDHIFNKIKTPLKYIADDNRQVVLSIFDAIKYGKFPYTGNTLNKLTDEIYDILSDNSNEILNFLKTTDSNENVKSIFNKNFEEVVGNNITDTYKIINYSGVKNTVNALIDTTVNTTPATGKGEIALCVMFNDLTKIGGSNNKDDAPKAIGDVIAVDSANKQKYSIEVKGSNAKLIGQSGSIKLDAYSDVVLDIVKNSDVVREYLKNTTDDDISAMTNKEFTECLIKLSEWTKSHKSSDEAFWNKNGLIKLFKKIFIETQDNKWFQKELYKTIKDTFITLYGSPIDIGPANVKNISFNTNKPSVLEIKSITSTDDIDELVKEIEKYLCVKHFEKYWEHLTSQKCKYFTVFNSNSNSSEFLVLNSSKGFQAALQDGKIIIGSYPKSNKAASSQGRGFSISSSASKLNESIDVDGGFYISIEDLLVEGGKAVNGRRILQSEVPEILDKVNSLLGELGLKEHDDFRLIGSAGKKKVEDTSGDIDIAVSTEALSKAFNCNNDIKTLLDKLNEYLESKGFDRIQPQYGFKQVSFGLPINGPEDQVQVDFMLSQNLDWSEFMNYSPDFRSDESKYKGSIRNILLMNIVKYCFRKGVKQITTKDGKVVDSEVETYVIRLTDGVYQTRKSFLNAKGDNIVKNSKLLHEYDKFITNTPQELVDILFTNADVKDTYSFESLYNLLLSDKFKYPQYLDKIIPGAVNSFIHQKMEVPTEIDQKYIELAKQDNVYEMKHILSWNKFIKLNEKLSEDELKQNADITDNEEVIIIPGRFQPFHNGHLAMIKNANKIFNKPVCVMQIKSKTDKSPIPEELLRKICKDVEDNEQYIKSFTIFPLEDYGKAVASYLVKYARRLGFEPVGFGCGEDRLSNWNMLVNWMKSDKTDTFIKPEFEVKSCDDRSGGYSGTKVREAIANNDYELFKSMVPEYLWKYYDELKKYIY